jgi:hypothetical protein
MVRLVLTYEYRIGYSSGRIYIIWSFKAVKMSGVVHASISIQQHDYTLYFKIVEFALDIFLGFDIRK